MIAGPARSGHERWRRVTGPEVVEIRVWIERARHPGLRATISRRVQTAPAVRARVAGLHRDGVELPAQLAIAWIERLQESRRIEIVARSDDDMVANDHGRRRREILVLERCDHRVPAFLAGAGVQTDEIVVRSLEEQPVAIDPDA